MSAGVAMQPGRRFAERYRLDRPNGTGQWIAHDEVLARRVLLSFAPPTDPRRAEFRSDALALARISHPHIVATYDTGVDDDGTAFRVDEFIEAELLSSLRNAGTLTPARVVTAIAQVAKAIEHAHANGLAHGRLSGDDVLVCDDDRVKLAGLGVAGETRVAADDVPALVRLFVELANAAGGTPAALASTWLEQGEPTTPNAIRRALLALETGPDDATPMTSRDRTPPAGVPVPARRSWVPLAALTLLAGAALALAGWLIDGPGSGEDELGQPIVATATSFDPEARPPVENEQTIARVVDGDAATSWSTETYRSRPFAGLKAGVGFILRTGADTTFTRLAIDSPSRGWSARVYVAEAPASSLAGWGEPVTQREGISTPVVFDLAPARGTAVLVWITDTGPARRVQIAEARLEGRR